MAQPCLYLYLFVFVYKYLFVCVYKYLFVSMFMLKRQPSVVLVALWQWHDPVGFCQHLLSKQLDHRTPLTGEGGGEEEDG